MTGPVLLVFCADTDLPWLRWLKPGFRHVFAALPVAGGWVTVDPLSTCLDVAFHPMAADSDLAGWFRSRGHVVLAVRRHRPPCPAPPLAPLTCVSVAKHLLGLRAPLVQTPWQLYRHLGGIPPRPRSQEPPALARLVSSSKPSTGTASSGTATAATTTLAAATPTITAVPAATTATAGNDDAGEQSLLRRATGRAGTVLTGWRGILTPGALAPTRKMLLGE